MTYRYTECGLDTVIIEGMTTVTDDAGEECITIPNINGLHRVIALSIVSRRTSMTGKEMRFLRTELGMTQAELADMVHREPLAISRWERGECPIDSNAEAVIRVYVVERLGASTDERLSVRDISGWCVPSADTPPIRIDGSDPSQYRPLDRAA